ncbi:MAG TPA: alpha/beta hydrolase [Pyrinomonadaceae bacterium]|nr:alpha/beta hydrolase [Pyrinomonadaceae bacterium]
MTSNFVSSKIALVLFFILTIPAVATAQLYTVISFDPKGDCRDPSQADLAQLSYRYDKAQDFFWFRIAHYTLPNVESFSVNLVIDSGGDEALKMNWWGNNKTFKFDRLVTAAVSRGENGYTGTIGVTDPAGIAAHRMNNLRQDNLQIRVEGNSILIGLKRTDITDKQNLNLLVAVGPKEQWNDEIPNFGSAALDLATATPGVREIDVGRNNLELPKTTKTLANNLPPVIKKLGHGKQPLILVPGMYSGDKSFDGFIARNQAHYKFFLISPPGLHGTPPRVMPSANISFNEPTWTRLFERDILDLIRREKLKKPVIVAERQPAAQAAIELALDHPDQIGGVILVGTNLVQFFPAPKDPTRKIPIAFADRAVLVDDGWAAQWFKFVTPETWKNGDLQRQLLSVEPARAQTAWDELEAVPVEIKIRYLLEFWASDVTRGFERLKIPVLALVPAFDEKFLADPANGFAKPSFLDSWETLVPKHPQLELVKIPGARMLVLDDQPQAADDAIASFVKKI